MLTATDELRHPLGNELHVRESLYFNFNDPRLGIGGWIYVWVLPNQPLATGMLVAFYKGLWAAQDCLDRANENPGHQLRRAGDWLYCVQRNGTALVDDDFDDFSFDGLHVRRLEPLKSCAISFEDGEGSSFDLQFNFLTPPYDYAEGAHPTPSWMAANRYHRAHAVTGELNIGGERLAVNCTGDSDHSWGLRDMDAFGRNRFKMWSMQSADHRVLISVIDQGVGDCSIALGFVSIDGEMASASTIRSRTRFDDQAIQAGIELEIEDTLGRKIRARMPGMHSCVGWRATADFWGVEGVGAFEIEGQGAASGLSSYFWPSRIAPEALAAGQWS
jgi:hypothetical protein